MTCVYAESKPTASDTLSHLTGLHLIMSQTMGLTRYIGPLTLTLVR